VLDSLKDRDLLLTDSEFKDPKKAKRLLDYFVFRHLHVWGLDFCVLCTFFIMCLDGDVYEITTEPNDLGVVRDALEEKGYSFLSAEVQYIPQTTTVLEDEESITKMEKLIDMMEENDDVQAIWHNWEMPESDDEE
jgi:hypothetical protein